jgi:hypothetical protein
MRFNLPSHSINILKYFLSTRANSNIFLYSSIEDIPGSYNRGQLLSRPWRTFHIYQISRIALTQSPLFSLVSDNTTISKSALERVLKPQEV